MSEENKDLMEALESAEKAVEAKDSLLPAIALRALNVFPGLVIHFDISREKSVAALEQAMLTDEKVFLVAQRDPNVEDPTAKDVYTVGTIAVVRQLSRIPNEDVVRVLVEGLQDAKLLGFTERTEYLEAKLQPNESEELVDSVALEAMEKHLEDLLVTYGAHFPKVTKSIGIHKPEVMKYDEAFLNHVIFLILSNLPVEYDAKQTVLEATSITERYEAMSALLLKETDVAKIRDELAEKMKSRVDKHQREYILREQMQFIRDELGDSEDYSDTKQFEEGLAKLKASAEVKEKIKKEIARFKAVAASHSEAAVERGYIETLLELPWDKMSKDNNDILHAMEVLDEDHYGLTQVKERMVEFLAVRALTKQGDSPILCLVGPPGTGKTSIARSVADALNKKYVRICLGGVRDEAEIRGHRKTYVGAMPGRIVAGLRQAGVKNPLMLLDEIDKVGKDQRGDTASALLEVLDSEQNAHFRDHYVELPIDLSEVLFLATANSLSDIPKPLLDRMEILEVSGYTANEKFHIAKEHLVPKQYEKNGLDEKRLTISDGALREVINGYTREAGVRELERKIGQICRKTAKKILTEKVSKVSVTTRNLEAFLGKRKYQPDSINQTDEVGIVRGLAWTSVGGDTLQVEVNLLPGGKGELELTGQLGDVMKESAHAGLSYIRSVSGEYSIDEKMFKEYDFHIHIPEGAVPKDGPSAGITMATAVLSALTGRKVRADVAMTGEITLRGRVLPIGGLKEKILAAKMAGVKTVLVPKENERDVREIDREITAGISIVYVETMKQVIEHAFV